MAGEFLVESPVMQATPCPGAKGQDIGGHLLEVFFNDLLRDLGGVGTDLRIRQFVYSEKVLVISGKLIREYHSGVPGAGRPL